jgi:hypothetical protein
MSDNSWDEVEGQPLAQISVGSGAYIWGVDSGGIAYRYQTVQPKPNSPVEYVWVTVPGVTLKNISVGMDGTVYGVGKATTSDPDNDGKIYATSSGGSSSGGGTTPSWTPIDGPKLAEVSVGDATQVWAVDESGNIFKATFDDDSTIPDWQQVAGSLKWVSAAGDGTVYGVNSSCAVFVYEGGNKPAWTPVHGQTLAQISVGDVARIWGVDSSGGIHQYAPDSVGDFKWQQIEGPSLQNIAAGADGVVYGVAPDSKVYVYVE